jgi:hypothetical protein
MGQAVVEASDGELFRALALLAKALEILDALDAPGHIGAHIDLASCNTFETCSEQNAKVRVTS